MHSNQEMKKKGVEFYVSCTNTRATCKTNLDVIVIEDFGDTRPRARCVAVELLPVVPSYKD